MKLGTTKALAVESSWQGNYKRPPSIIHTILSLRNLITIIKLLDSSVKSIRGHGATHTSVEGVSFGINTTTELVRPCLHGWTDILTGRYHEGTSEALVKSLGLLCAPRISPSWPDARCTPVHILRLWTGCCSEFQWPIHRCNIQSTVQKM